MTYPKTLFVLDVTNPKAEPWDAYSAFGSGPESGSYTKYVAADDAPDLKRAAEAPYIAPVENDADIILSPAPNGGWIVKAAGAHASEMDRILGAFSTAGEMLAALASGFGARQ